MATLRDIRTRIGAVKNTRQITSAMKMVSAAKLRRAMEAATNARPYQQMLSATLRRVAAAAGEVEEPLLMVKPNAQKVLLVQISTDRGLCGGFNGTLNRRADDWVRAQRAQGRTVHVRTFGKKARDYWKSRGLTNDLARTDVTSPKYTAEATALAAILTDAFTSEGGFDEVYLGYNRFKSTLSQVPTFTRILPIAIESGEAAAAAPTAGAGIDYIYEPKGREILGALLPLYLRTILLQALLENEAGEQAARMTAMDNATRNASDLIKALTLDYNRGRQAAITKELIEIVSGAEAL